MTSTISSVKSKNPLLGMMKWTIKKSLPLAIAYSFLLMVAFPMYVTLLKQSDNRNFDYAQCEVFSAIAPIVIDIFTIIIGLIMFSIYHNKRSVDLYAAFPIKKRTLFLARYFSGLIILIIPLIVFMTLGLLASMQVNSLTVFITFYRMLGFIIAIINIYSMLAFLSMLCGGTTDTTVSFAVVNIGVLSIVNMVLLIITFVLPGYTDLATYTYEIEQPLYMALYLFCSVAMPFFVSSFSELTYDSLSTALLSNSIDNGALKIEIIYMVIWLLLAVIYVAASIIIVKKRKNENVQNGFIYSLPKVIIQVVASLGAALYLGWSFADSCSYYNDGFKTMLMFMLGALLGSFAAFLIVTLIYNRGPKRFVKSLPTFVCSFAAVGIFYLVVSLGLVGVSNIPKAEDIKAVAVCAAGYYDGSSKEIISAGGYFEDEEFINNALNLNQSIIDGLHDSMGTFFNLYSYNDTIYNDYSYEPSSISIVYELNNGKTVSKSYYDTHYIYDNIIDEYNSVVSYDKYKQCKKLTKCSTAEEANAESMYIYSQNRYTTVSPVTAEEYYGDEFNYESVMFGESYTQKIYDEDYLNELEDYEFLNKVYTSLREEYLADKNVAETLKAKGSEYVEPTGSNSDIYDEVSYVIRIDYSLNLNYDKYVKMLEESEYDESYLVDSSEEYVVTKESYPKTYELINSYFVQEKNCTDLYLYS